jgi:hypothetical protein
LTSWQKRARDIRAAKATYDLVMVQYAIPFGDVVPFALFQSNALMITAFCNAWKTVNGGAGVTSLALHFEVPSPPYGKSPSFSTNIQGIVDMLTGKTSSEMGLGTLGNPQMINRIGLHVVMENDADWQVQPYTVLTPVGYAAFTNPETQPGKLPTDPSLPTCQQVLGGIPVSADVPWPHSPSYFLDPGVVGMSFQSQFGGNNQLQAPGNSDSAEFQTFAGSLFNGLNQCPYKGAGSCYATVIPGGPVDPMLDLGPSQFRSGWPIGCPANIARCAWYMLLINRLIAKEDPTLKRVSYIVFDNEFENPPDGISCTLYQFIRAMVQFGATEEDLLPNGHKWGVYVNKGAATNDAFFSAVDPKKQGCIDFMSKQTGVGSLTYGDVLEPHAAGEQYWMQGNWFDDNGKSVGGDIGNDRSLPNGGLASWLEAKGGYVGCTESSAYKKGANYKCGCRNTIYNTLSGPDPVNVDKLLGPCALGPLYEFIDSTAPYSQGMPTFSIESLGPADSAIEFASPGCIGTLNYCGTTGGKCLASAACASKCGVANIFGTWPLDNFGLFLDKFAKKFNIAGNPTAPGIMVYDAAFLPLTWISQVVDSASYSTLLALQAAAQPCVTLPGNEGLSTCSAAIENNEGYFTPSGSDLPYCGPCPTPTPASAFGLDCPAPIVVHNKDCVCDCVCPSAGCPHYDIPTGSAGFWGKNGVNQAPVGGVCAPFTTSTGQVLDMVEDTIWGTGLCMPSLLVAQCPASDLPDNTHALTDPSTALFCTAAIAADFGVTSNPRLAGPMDCWCIKEKDDPSKCNATPPEKTCKCPCACGASGSSGSSVQHGHSGSSGQHGHSGSSGSSVQHGRSGSSGSSVQHGRSGSSGSSVQHGRSGSSGQHGHSGSSGQHGHSGSSGQHGHSGSSGQHGHSGSSVNHGGSSVSHGGSSVSHGGSSVSHGGSSVSHGGSSVSHGGSSVSHGGSSVSHGGSSVSHGGSSVSRGGSSVSHGGSSVSHGGSSVSRGGSSVSHGGSSVSHGGSSVQHGRSGSSGSTVHHGPSGSSGSSASVQPQPQPQPQPQYIRRFVKPISAGQSCGAGYVPLADQALTCVTASCAATMPPMAFRPQDALFCTQEAADYYRVQNARVVGKGPESPADCWCVAGPQPDCTGSGCAGGSSPSGESMNAWPASGGGTLPPWAIAVIVIAIVIVLVAIVCGAYFGTARNRV